MPNEPPRIYLDSCAYISYIQQDEGRIEVLSAVMQQAIDGDIVLVASSLVIAEVVKLKNLGEQGTPLDEQARLIREFFENDYIKIRNVDRMIATHASEISREHGVKPPDAIHLATALKWNCKSFQTYDGESGGPGKLIALDGKLGNPGLRIELPRVIGDDKQKQFI